MRYYPKLLSSIPFTPVTGPRLAVVPNESSESVRRFVMAQIRTLCQANGYSSWHCLFTPVFEDSLWKASNLVRRGAIQFHWFNKGYETFEHYLMRMSSKRRKNIKRERRRIQEQGIKHHWKPACDMTDVEWTELYRCYAYTYLKRAQAPYLNITFFKQLADAMVDSVLCLMAERDNHIVASALFLVDNSTLYGRYWGSIEEEVFLHFETCYYQGIEYAIQHGLTHFDAGVQGEHKIRRGFEPTETCSWHWIEHPEFREAITHYVAEEAKLVEQYRSDCAQLLPFK